LAEGPISYTPTPPILQPGTPLRVEGGPAVRSIAFSPDNTILATAGADSFVRLFDMRSPDKPPRLLQVSERLTHAVAISQRGSRLVVASETPTVGVWDLRNLDARPLSFTGPGTIAASIAVSADGTRLAVGYLAPESSILLWDLQNPTQAPVAFRGHQSSVDALAFSPDGRYLASGGREGTVRLWDVSNPEASTILYTSSTQATSAVFSSATFSPSGDRLVVTTGRGLLIIEVRHPRLAPIAIEQSRLISAAFSPDGNRLATNALDGSVQLWPLWTEAADYLCSRVSRNLSMEEWRLDTGEGIPYERTCPKLPPGAGAP
jgi:WD40 repeat protein